MEQDHRIQLIRKTMVKYSNFPKEGFNFIDIFPLIANHTALNHLIDIFAEKLSSVKYNKIFMLESRGFLLGVPLSLKVNKPCYPIRKKGKLPGEVAQYSYNLEYGTDTIEVQKHCVNQGDQVVIIDDILATGGTLNATIALLKDRGAKIVKILLINQIGYLKGRDNLNEEKGKVDVVFTI